jgi:TonB-linked SusC/RagA family outer membrane protein
MNLKNKLTIIVILLFNISLFAQNSFVLKGNVVAQNDNSPIPGTSIIIKDTSKGTSTDFDGNFQLEVKTGDILQFSFLGYMTQTITIKGQTILKVVLVEDAQSLDEIVVIGYGTQKKANVTGSISKLVNKKLDQAPTARIDDALKGQIAGVNILSSNTAAGEAPTITVRGQGSISYESNPLIVIDGIVVGTDTSFLSSIATNDVESIEVLKDASSSAIYGSRGANGVIVINTKKGVEGPARFSYNTYIGSQYVPDNDVLGNIPDWTKFVLANNNGVLTDELKYIQKLGTVTDWQALQIPGGTIQNHALSVSGGSTDTKYMASLSHLDDQGVLLTDSYQKLNFRINLNSKVNDKVSFGIVLNPSRTVQRVFPALLHDALRHAPWAPIRYDENNIQYVNRFRANG